jgi:hypothetical protein
VLGGHRGRGGQCWPPADGPTGSERSANPSSAAPLKSPAPVPAPGVKGGRRPSRSDAERP